MVGVGGIVSVGGAGGTGGSGSTSGILSINGQVGDNITFVGVSGIEIISPVADQINIGFTTPLSGVVGVNGIDVQQIDGNYVVDGASVSGTVNKFAESFSAITSGIFEHNLNTLDVIVQVYDDQTPRRQILPDAIKIENANEVSVLFNRPQSGRVVIL